MGGYVCGRVHGTVMLPYWQATSAVQMDSALGFVPTGVVLLIDNDDGCFGNQL